MGYATPGCTTLRNHALPVSSTYRDIESVYGFTGPVASTADGDFLAAAWQAFGTWCSTQHVVAEFVRAHVVRGFASDRPRPRRAT